jgi:hypothetical protein
MSSTAIQKLWAKDLAPSVVAMATAKAVEATAAWNATVIGVLRAAKAVYEVREKIGGAPSGSFAAWAEEELDRSHSTASCLAVIGSRYNAFVNVSKNLPASWGTLYELAKAPDGVFRRALRRVRPDMERNEMVCLVAEEWGVDRPKRKNKHESPQQKQETQAPPALSAPEPGHREAALTTIMAGSVWRAVKDLAERVNTALVSGALLPSPDAKKFMVINYIEPSIELLNAVETKLSE